MKEGANFQGGNQPRGKLCRNNMISALLSVLTVHRQFLVVFFVILGS